MTFITLSAYFYEILALAILDRIGLEEKVSNQSGMIIRSYGLMAMGSALGVWLLTLIKNSLLEWCVMLVVSFFVGFGIMWKRTLTLGVKYQIDKG